MIFCPSWALNWNKSIVIVIVIVPGGNLVGEYVIIIPWIVRLYVEIIHELREWIILRTGGQTWYNYFIPPTSV